MLRKLGIGKGKAKKGLKAGEHSWRIQSGNPLGRSRGSSADESMDALEALAHGEKPELDAVMRAGAADGAASAAEARQMTLWRAAVDGKTGKTYFFNIRTDETVWDLNEIPVWGKAVDSSSRKPYWYNTRTGKRTFDRPDDYESDGGGEEEVEVAAGSGAAEAPTEAAVVGEDGGKVVEW